MSIDFIRAGRDTPFLLSSILSGVAANTLFSPFFVDIMGQLNVSSLGDVYTGKGSRPYDPALLLSMLFYGYGTRVFSRRMLEKTT